MIRVHRAHGIDGANRGVDSGNGTTSEVRTMAIGIETPHQEEPTMTGRTNTLHAPPRAGHREAVRMHVMVYTHYGSPDVLQFTEVEKPTPKDHEVLIKVHASSANAADVHYLRGAPLVFRLQCGLLKPTNTLLGADVAGQIEAGQSLVRGSGCRRGGGSHRPAGSAR